jgi:heme/copper-type cytochrome/quinol oxidase subunit 2
MTRSGRNGIIALAGVTLAAAIWAQTAARGQAVREFSVDGNQFAFTPNRLEVQKDDLVKITFTALDMPHSITIDEYRVSKRAGAGQSVVVELRADRVGTFTFYCNLKQDERCRNMKGQLVVR